MQIFADFRSEAYSDDFWEECQQAQLDWQVWEEQRGLRFANR